MKKAQFIKTILPVFAFIIFILKLVAIEGCANIIPPAGGPRDSLPPLLERVDPPDSSLNFKDKTIVFTFDEYLDQLQNLQENFLVSPTPDRMPVVETKLRTLTVRIKDTLEANTTYYLNFGNAIRDINESNVLKDFSYIFSTGPVIDSLELSGKVILAETGKTDSTLIVMLHRNGDDSALIKDKPRYIARQDGRGNFHFRFLPAGTYYIYALKDDGGGRRYDKKTQLFAFADSPVIIEPETSPITLYAYAEKTASVSPGLSIGRPGGSRDDRRLKFTPNLVNGQQDLLSKLVITFEQPLRLFDSSKARLSTDSSFHPIPSYSWELDSTKRKISLDISWKENTLYNLILDKDFAEDTLGRKLLKTDTISFATKKRNEYGSLKIRFRNLELAKNPVLLFVQGDQLMRSYPLASENFTQPLFLPGEYEMRILFDNNRNGVWDPGEFFGKHRQPEIVRPVDRRITIKPNWTNEFEIAL